MRLEHCLLAAAVSVATLAAGAQERYDFDRTPGRLGKHVVPTRYALSFDLDPARPRFSARATIDITLRQPQSELVLHAHQLQAGGVQLSGAGTAPLSLRVRPDARAQLWRLRLPRPLPAGRYTLSMRYRGRVNASGEGLYRTAERSSPMLATQLQAVAARMLFPGFDEPAFRAVFQVEVRAPRGLQVVANMPEQSVEHHGATALHRYAPTPPMPSYLVALALGRFDVLEGTAAGVPLRILTAPGKRERARHALAATQQLLPYYSDYFGQPYALPKLDQLAVPSVRDGAMEDWGLISYNESALLYDPARSSPYLQRLVYETVAHEVAHQWFGNLVTAASWDEIWLNEAFATWLAEKATARFNPDWQVPLTRRAVLERALARDAGSTTRAIRSGPVHEERVFEVFDSITYDKGGAVLTMLEQALGGDVFQRGLAAYIAERQHSNATAGDLWHHLGAAAGRDIAAVARSWTDQPGHPLVQVQARCADDRTVLTLRQQRFVLRPEAAQQAGLWQTPVVVAHRGLTRTLLLDAAERRYELEGCDELPPVANAGGAGFYRVQYDAATRGALARRFADLAPADKVSLASDSYALAFAGRQPFLHWFELLAKLPAVRDASRASLFVHAAEGLESLDRASAGTPARAALRRAGRLLLGPELARLGWQAQPGDDAETRRLRARLIESLAGFDDPDVLQQAAALYQLDRSGRQALPGAIRAAVIRAAGRGADSARFDDLRRRLLAAHSEEDRRVLAQALASGRDPARARELLALTGSPALPPNLAVELPGLVAERSDFGALAYRHVLETWPRLARRAGGSDSGARAWILPAAADGFHERADAARLLADQRRLHPNGATPARQIAEAIELRAALREREAAALAEHLAAWQPQP